MTNQEFENLVLDILRREGQPLPPQSLLEQAEDPDGMAAAVERLLAGGRLLLTRKGKLALPEQMEALKPFPVQRVHLDTNGHVNNGQYVRMAEEFLPADDVIRELRVEYRTAAHLGDTIYPRRGTVTDGDGAWTVLALCDADGQPYVTLKVQ